jgi:TolB protein
MGRITIAVCVLTALSGSACSGTGGDSSNTATVRRTLHGSRIVFYVETGHRGTYAINPAGGGRTTIRVGSFATLSPDGSKMVYDRAPHSEDLYVANIDGTDELRLTRTKAREAVPAWSPDGSKIAFVEVRPVPDAVEGDLFVVGADGGTPSRLVSDVTVSGGGSPIWSPDGSKIALVRSGSTTRHGGLFIVDAAGGVSPERILINAIRPVWSPDSKRICFIRYDGSQPTLYVARADGSGPKRIAPRSYFPSGAAWSPDGSKIAFAGLAPHTLAEAIFTVQPDGSQLHQLTNAHAFELTWSPSGTKLAFTRQKGGTFNVWVVDAESSQTKALTRGNRAKSVLAWLVFA